MTPSRTAVKGSARPPVSGAERIGDVDGAKRAEVTVTLPARATPDPEVRVSRAEFAERYGADPAAIESLETFARTEDRQEKSNWLQEEHKLTNNVMLQVGLSLFIPFTFDYELPK